MGNTVVPCCEDGSSSALAGAAWRHAAPWAAVVDGVTEVYVDIDGVVHEDVNALRIHPAPGHQHAPPVPLYEGPDEQTRQLGFLEPGTPARMVDESSDGCWVRVQEESGSDRHAGRQGWVHARAVPQQVVSRLCARTDLGRPSMETVHAALSRNRGDLTDAVKDLRNQYASQVDGRARRALPPRIPVNEIAKAATDSRLLSPQDSGEPHSSTSALHQTARRQVRSLELKLETSGARADIV